MGKPLKEMTNEELWKLFPIMLLDFNPDWKKWYLEEEKIIVSIIGKSNIERINHIGSTSVKGLTAKPTIDMLLEIKEYCHIGKLIETLENIGYIYSKQPSKPAPHMMFMKGYTETGFVDKVFHLHIRYLGDWNELYFRDYLRINTDIADEYTLLKMDLMDKFTHNRDAYTDAKTGFICKYTTIARNLFGDKYKP